MKYYTGVGSRTCPQDVCEAMTKIAAILEEREYILRSGAADGADTAFELGVKSHLNKEIYLPWQGFNGHESFLFETRDEAFKIVRDIVDHYGSINRASQKLHARNAHQVLGGDLKSPSDFIICWTPQGKLVGGTATAITLARNNSIPIYNLGNPGFRQMSLNDFIEYITK
jgi:hypothetical protein